MWSPETVAKMSCHDWVKIFVECLCQHYCFQRQWLPSRLFVWPRHSGDVTKESSNSLRNYLHQHSMLLLRCSNRLFTQSDVGEVSRSGCYASSCVTNCENIFSELLEQLGQVGSELRLALLLTIKKSEHKEYCDVLMWWPINKQEAHNKLKDDLVKFTQVLSSVLFWHREILTLTAL